MAMVYCPGCSKKVSDKEKTCPDCGTLIKINFTHIFVKNIPTYKRLQLIGAALMYVGCALLLLELFGKIETYVGTVMVGLGFALHGLSIIKREKEKADKRRGLFMLLFGAFIFVAGVIFIVFR